MQDQPISGPGERMDRADNDLLHMLCADDSHRPWSVDEIAGELQVDPTDALGRLSRAGLIHRLESFVWATRPAARSHELHDL
jgi:hypothetical protein